MVCGIGAGVAFALANGGGGPELPSVQKSPPFPSLQNATASADGIRVALTSAQFSGTATMLAVSVTPENPPVSQVQEIAIRRASLTGGSLQPLADAQGGLVAGKSAAQFLLRMTPVQGAGPAGLQISTIDVMFRDGSARVLNGPWTLPVAVPADVSQLLDSQVLRAGAPASLGGVSVSIAAAVRSETETLVTVHIAGPSGVQFLEVPTLTCNGRVYQGRLMSSPGGSDLSYTFPATPIGAAASLTMRDAVQPTAGAGRYVDVDLARAMARDGLSGASGDQGVLLPTDVVSTNAPELTPSFIQFIGQGGPGVKIMLGSALTPGQFGGSRPMLILPDGSSVSATTIGTGFDHDATGAITGGHSNVEFLLPTSRLKGVVRISVGSQDSVITGAWTVSLQP